MISYIFCVRSIALFFEHCLKFIFLVQLFLFNLQVTSLLIAQEVEEIVVNADPLKSTVKNSSNSSSVISKDNLPDQGSQLMENTFSLIPNLNFAGGTSSPRFFQIRGIGELEQYEGAPNYSVGFFLDDFDLSGIASSANVFDLSQLEVLRGPQGTAYGANALAGIIKVNTTEALANQINTAKFSFGSDDFVNGAVAIGSAIDEKTFFRLSLFNEQQDGFRNNLFLNKDDTNNRDTNQAYLKIRHLLSDDSTLDLNFLRSYQNNGFDAFNIENSFNNQSDQPGKDQLGITATSFKVRSKLDSNLLLTSITSSTRADQKYSFDGDWGNNSFWSPYDPYDFFFDSNRQRSSYYQELRLSDTLDSSSYKLGQSGRYLFGVFGQRFFEESLFESFSSGKIYDKLNSKYDSSTLALFAQKETPILDKTSVTTGLRVEQKNASYQDSRQTDEEPKDTMIGGNISVQRSLSQKNTGYVLASRGYRASGINTGIFVPKEQRVFEQEGLWNFETGVKGILPYTKLNSNLSLFYQLNNNPQSKTAIQFDPSDPLTFTFLTVNADQATGYGLEWEVYGNLSNRLFLQSQVSLLNTELNQRDRYHAPNWSYSVGPKYLFTDNIFFQFQLRGMDRFYFDESHNQRSSPYHIFNSLLSYEEEKYRVSLWARNLFNQRYAVRGFFFGNEPPDFREKEYVQLGDPRIFGVSFDIWF